MNAGAESFDADEDQPPEGDQPIQQEQQPAKKAEAEAKVVKASSSTTGGKKNIPGLAVAILALVLSAVSICVGITISV